MRALSKLLLVCCLMALGLGWPWAAPRPAGADSAPLWESPVGLAPGLPGVKVQMSAETVDIKVVERDNKVLAVVAASFDLYNPGPATRMQVGFPALSLLSQKTGEVFFDPNSQRLSKFRAWAGRETYTPRETRVEGMPWAVWEMTFPAAAVTVLQVSYEQQLADLNEEGLARLFYVMTTGALWDGDIGEAVITVAAPQGLLVDALPEGGYLSGSRAVWQWHDFEPTEDIAVVYVPEATRRVLVDLDKAIAAGVASPDDYLAGARAILGMTRMLWGQYPPSLKDGWLPQAVEWATIVTEAWPDNAEAWEIIGQIGHLGAQQRAFLRCWPARSEEAYQRAVELGSATAGDRLAELYSTRDFMSEVGGPALDPCH